MTLPAASQPGSSSRPHYAERFRCIGSACEDTCCAGWTVPIDRATWDKYQSLPESPLRILVNASMTPREESAEVAAEGAAPAALATIRMNAQNQCPLLTEDRLCRIHAQVGESFLSHTCATYPRIVASVDGMAETTLALSCPEAARLVLLTPDLFTPNQETCDPIQAVNAVKADAPHDPSSPQAWLMPIREVTFRLVRNRDYPLWQRVFLLGLLCRRLDSTARGELKRSIPAFLGDFEAAVAAGSLCAAMQTLPVDRKAQLDLVLMLAGMMLRKSNVRPRFVECIQAFTAGIGNGPGATLDSLAAHYANAHDRHFEPFFLRHPHILENYLIHTVFRRQFPFGREGLAAGSKVDRTREFALFCAQFALMRGLLIGVAGFHGQAFSAKHVVHTVQAASKHFEHHPEFLKLAHELLVNNKMDGARGMAILLRNAEVAPGARAARPAAPERADSAPVAERLAGEPVAVPG